MNCEGDGRLWIGHPVRRRKFSAFFSQIPAISLRMPRSTAIQVVW